MGKGEQERVAPKFCKLLLLLEMGLKLEGSDFDKPGFFKNGEMSASLKLVGKVAWENDNFASWETRREKVSAHDFRRDVGI